MRDAIQLRPVLELLGDALWLRPALAIATGLGVGFALSQVEVPGGHPLLYTADASAARDTLMSIIGATLTVTATVFGFIIVTLQVAATQFSPRSLRSFVRDRGTQTSLGVFLGVVAYALAVLIRTSDGRPDAPDVAMTLAVALVLAVVAALTYLIHHTAQSIRIEHLMASITDDTLETLRDRTSRHEHRDAQRSALPAVPAEAEPVPARSSGYIDGIAVDVLAGLAARCGVSIALRLRVGEHCVEHLPLAWVWARQGRVDRAALAQLTEGINDAVSVGLERTMLQDVAFGPRQLVDIALRAMSPAINDPRTCVEAIKNLTRILCALSDRPLLPDVRCDESGGLLVALPRLGFDDYVALACDQIRRFAAHEPAVTDALLHMLEHVAMTAPSPDRRAVLRRHTDLIEDAARRETAHPADLAAVQQRAERVRQVIGGERPERWEELATP